MNQSQLNAWFVTSVLLNILLHTQPIAAQVIPDATLPQGERSQVTGNPNFQIDGGARRGGNLFHSFDQFSIPTGGSASFNNAADVQNIFSRVTGGSVSTIDGVIRANGAANLFLLNPNGILFGPNASLNVGGSFVGTTANAIGFPTGEVFSSDATQPLPSQLLTVNPNTLFFNQLTPQPVINQSTFNELGLQVPAGQNLLLVGGPIQLDGGRLISPGGQIELAAIGGMGTVGLSTTDADWRLNIPSEVTRADISLRNGSSDVSVEGDRGSSIRMLAQNIDISGGSIRVGISRGLGFPNAQTGDIELNATGSITISDNPLTNILAGQGNTGSIYLTAGDRITISRSRLLSTAEPGSLGNVGNVTITAGTIVFEDTLLIANTSQQTNASNIFINARDRVSLDSSVIFNTVESTGTGNGGSVNITTGSLALTRGAQIVLFTMGKGNAGDINIDARDAVSLDDNSFIFNTVESTASGNAGSISITTGSFALTRGAQLITSTYGQGNAGSVNINARDTVSLDSGLVLNLVEPEGIGNTSGININTGSLALTGGAQLLANVNGQGNAGGVNINARGTVSVDGSLIFNTVAQTGIGSTGGININTGSLTFTQGSQLNTTMSGRGNTGSVNINARDTVVFDSDGSGVLNTVEPTGIGNTGGINITTGSLALTRGARLVASTHGQGSAGSVNINARDTVSLSGSTVLNDVEPRGIGNTGGINITTESLALTQGAQLSANTSGQGNASNITLTAQNRISVDGESLDGGVGSAIFSRVNPNGVGRGGNLVITTGSLSLTNGGAVNTATDGRGDAGSVTIHARDSVEIRGRTAINAGIRSGIFTTATEESVGNGGDVTITTGSLSVADEGRIITDVRSRGNAGSIQIQASDAVLFDRGDAVSTLSQGGVGRGGNIDITGRSLSLLNGAQLATSTRGQGDAGNVTINTRDTVTLTGSDRTSPSAITTQVEAGAVGTGGQINITTGSVSLTRGAQLVTTTLSQGRAGNISINARDRVTVSGTDSNYGDRTPSTNFDEASVINAGPASGLFANTEPNSTGEGGDIRVATGQLTVEAGGRLVASTAGQNNAGNIRVRATNGVTLSGTSPDGFSSGLLTNTESTSTGRGGAIRVDTAALRVNQGAVLSARSSSTASGGEIIVNADTVDLTRGGQLLTTAFSSGQAGNITVTARDRFHIAGRDATFAARLARFGRPTVDPVNAASGLFTNTEANSSGAGGAIALTAGSLSLLNGGRLVTSTAGRGDAGNITVNSSNLRLFGASSGLFAQTFTTANAGNLTIQPQGNSQRVTVQLQEGAQISASTSNSGRGGRLTITAPESVTLTGNGSIISAETSGRGTGGNLNLRTGNLNIQNQAEVTVSSAGRGSAGSLFVDADRIFLNNGGRIRADTSGGGGNINLRSPFILLRNGSNITTNATGANIPGGDIGIDTRFLIAVSSEDSNISANSEDFRGGNVSISAATLFGIQPQLIPTSSSDITATGATSALPGTLDITTAGIDPTSGLVTLPADIVDASGLIAQGCPADAGNSFVITGRGGLPPTPAQELDDAAEWQDRSILTVAQQTREREARDLTSDASAEGLRPSVPQDLTTAASMVEATVWHRTAAGEVILIADTPDPTIQNSLHQSATCNNRS